ncbi:MAG: hypothetical protein ACTHMM_12055 [Agriterribacter sp.]
MKIRISSLDIVRKQMSKMFWSGYRWIAFNESGLNKKFSKHAFFCNYADAVNFCRYPETNEGISKIKAIADLLKILHGRMITTQDRPIIEDTLNAYPLIPFHQHEDLPAGLATQAYFPALWQTWINPLTNIGKYHIIELPPKRKILVLEENEINILKSHALFKNAINHYERLVKKSITRHQLLLIGQFLNHKLVLSPKGQPTCNSGLLLYSTQHACSFECLPINDICAPLRLSWPIIIRYNTKKNRLDFFDEKLKKIPPGTPNTYIDLGYLDYSPSLLILP